MPNLKFFLPKFALIDQCEFAKLTAAFLLVQSFNFSNAFFLISLPFTVKKIVCFEKIIPQPTVSFSESLGQNSIPYFIIIHILTVFLSV
jgi:hypothetical protein